MRAQTLTLIFRSRTLPHLPVPIRHSLFLYHTGAGDEYHQRRTEPQPPPPLHHSPSFHRRNYDEENRAVKVTVWWDFENCNVPTGINVERVAGRITAALRSTGIKGPVTITAFGDVAQMSRGTQEALTSTGVYLSHVPNSGKNSSDRSFMADLVYWVTQNPPPAHFFLISTDKDFANILHRLRMSNYNILLCSKEYATAVLCSAATIMWPWVGLVKGENVTAKHFNHPPDGLYGSWYGHYKGVLDDPFVDSEQCSVQQEESVESVSETKVRPVPKEVVNGIRNVLHSYPEGMYISELRAELRRKNVPLDRDFYGHIKFSCLLFSMPSVVKFIPNPSGEGQPLVTDKRVVGSVEITSKSTKDIESRKADEVPTSATDEKLLSRDDIPSHTTPTTTIVESAPSRDVTNVDTDASLPTPQVHDAVADGGLGVRKETPSEPPIAEKGHNAEVKDGVFKRIWTTLTGTKGDHPYDKSDSIAEVDSTAREDAVNGANPKRSKAGKKAAEARSSSTNSASFSTSSVGANKSDPEEKLSEQYERLNGTAKPRIGFFSRVTYSWQSWMYGAKDQEDSPKAIKKVESYQEADANRTCVRSYTQIDDHPKTHGLFSQSHFWDAVESYLLSSKGSNLITKSITRQPEQGKQDQHPCDVSIEANPPENLVELKAWFQKAYSGKKNVQPEEFQKLFESR